MGLGCLRRTLLHTFLDWPFRYFSIYIIYKSKSIRIMHHEALPCFSGSRWTRPSYFGVSDYKAIMR